MSLSMNPVNWSPNTKKNVATVGVLALAGGSAKIINNKTKNKTYAWNQAINKPLKKFIKSETKFAGSELLKDVANKIVKASARQKILGVLTAGTLGAVMILRDHFSKENGKEMLKPDIEMRDAQIKARDIRIQQKNDKISKLEADLMVKDSEIAGLNKSIDAIDKAAEKLGVDKDLAQEIVNQIQE